jgi:hypothetical protein
MLADKLFIPAITASSVSHDFDFVHETEHSLRYTQVKMPSLSDYDHSDYDNEEADILLGLTRWGDLQFPSRLLAE